MPQAGQGTAIPATSCTRSGTGKYLVTTPPMVLSSTTTSLKETGTLMMRPSNSGIATDMAVSSGVRPAALCAHSAWLLVLEIA